MGVEFGDITDRLVVDLGAGTGRLSIASAYFQPLHVFSVDVDPNAIRILQKNVRSLEMARLISPVCVNVGNCTFSLRIRRLNAPITTIMNPPFGVKSKGADRVFLKNAFNISDVVYSIHLAGEKTRAFLHKYVRKLGWLVDYTFTTNMVLEKSFPFHSKRRKRIQVDIYKFIQKK